MDYENKNIDFKHLFTDQLKEEYNKKEGPVKRIFAVMTFNTEFEMGLSNKPYEWVNSSNTVTLDGVLALYTYIHSDNPMTKIVDGESFEELNKNMIEMTNNFKNPFFVEKEINSMYY